ncbi:MAG: hypothetical protein WC546_01735 [Candidatus Omnitrophota bacterium]|jgi:hypothetical protein
MKWLTGVVRAIILFASLAMLGLIFNTVMQMKTTAWQSSNVALGAIPKAAIAMHLFVRQNLMVVAIAILVFCFVLAFIEAARKK